MSFLVCGCLLTDDGGNCCVTYQIVMIQNVLISDFLFKLSLWQGMLGTLMTVWKHVVGIQIGVTQVCTSVRGFFNWKFEISSFDF